MRRLLGLIAIVATLVGQFFIAPAAAAFSLKCSGNGGYTCFNDIPSQTELQRIRDLVSNANGPHCFISCTSSYLPSDNTCANQPKIIKNVSYKASNPTSYYQACNFENSAGTHTISCGNNSSCTQSDTPCTTNDDCKQDAGVAVCESGYCYYDTEAARLAAKADVGILGIDAQIHLQKPQPSIHIPGLNFSDVADTLDSEGNIHVPYLGQYIAALYKFGMAAASAIAVVMIIKKGFDIAISPGGEVKQESYQRIGQIIVGLALVWGSYGLLYAINPQLVAFKVLSINYIQPVPLSDRIGERDEQQTQELQQKYKLPSGTGDVNAANLTPCPPMQVGAQFEGAFTTYVNIQKYGDPSGYTKNYTGDPSKLLGMGPFFCAVAMECGCPSNPRGSKVDTSQGEVCKNTKHTWAPCAYFDSNTKFCGSGEPAGKYIPGKTVAASICFPNGTQIRVNGDNNHIVTVTDIGYGIIGTHFDLYLGHPGGDAIDDTSWLKGPDGKTHLEIVKVGKNIYSDKKMTEIRAKYNKYTHGQCTPGKNC